MSLTEDDVKQILRFMDASNFEELNLKTGDLHLIISKRKGGSNHPISLSLPEEQAASPLPATPSAVVVAMESNAVATGPTQAPVATELPSHDGLTPISAPTLGVFYSGPKPDAPAFVEEGDLVEETDTVCIIEVMKLFNHIKAGVRGRVAKICADNGAMVEHGQLLFLIEPESN